MKTLDIKSNAEFLFKLRYPQRIMVGMNPQLLEAMREAGFEAFDAVAGGETAGIPFGAWIAERLALPMLYVRKKPKGFGRDGLELQAHEIPGIKGVSLPGGAVFFVGQDLLNLEGPILEDVELGFPFSGVAVIVQGEKQERDLSHPNE